MPKSPESPKKYTPEEIADLEKSRTISDTELLKDGAKYEIDEEGNKHLSATDEQIKSIEKNKEWQDSVKLLRSLNGDELIKLTFQEPRLGMYHDASGTKSSGLFRFKEYFGHYTGDFIVIGAGNIFVWNIVKAELVDEEKN